MKHCNGGVLSGGRHFGKSKMIELGGVGWRPLILAAALVLTGVVSQFCDAETVSAVAGESERKGQVEGLSGSASCRRCHEDFYKLWESSHHGRAMQPFTPEFARRELVAARDEIEIGEYRYRAEIEGGNGWIFELGPDGEKKYAIEHALGGKNVYYFLTPMERGRLQVLPLAFDVRRKRWFDTTSSMLRHLAGRHEEPVDWRDPALTFNTSCHSCHVSQFSRNYDLKSDTYRTAWIEPGINCESCHGPGAEHVRVCADTPEGQVPKDLRIIITKGFTAEQTNAMCAPCHAKMRPLTTTFKPGDRYFDHYGLVTLEHPDFYPDGRDLGENYTYTLWRMSPCVKSGKLDCMHCHTSSGRYRFEGEQANDACMPCHRQRVENATVHTHHAGDSEANKCISCHMPQSEFALMRRTDHSMRPPTPATTIEFGSPNACNLCHADKEAVWADKWVRKWHRRNYQKPILKRAGLIEAARKRDWSALPEMLAYLKSGGRDEIYTTSLVRLLGACEDDKIRPVFRKLLKDRSALVRSAAAEALATDLSKQTVEGLLRAAGDDYRLVRLSAAAALAPLPRKLLKTKDVRKLELASLEYEMSLQNRPDDTFSHYNLGNYYFSRGLPGKALESFGISSKLRPDNILPLVNASIVYAHLGRRRMAEKSLRKALKVNPSSPEVNFNLALLTAETGDVRQGERLLRRALKTDPNMAEAAYNLGVILAADRLTEAVKWCRKASRLRPNDPKYAYTFAFYLQQSGNSAEAVGTLLEMLSQKEAYPAAYSLLGAIYEQRGKPDKATDVYKEAATNKELPKKIRHFFASKIRILSLR